MRANKTAANASMVAGMGGYGCRYYNATGAATEYAPLADDRHVAVVQALTDTTIKTVKSAWDAPADVDGLDLPAGTCLFVKAASVTITDGTGILYYGSGAVVPEPEAGES